ncbi:MAG: hypothetical protein RM338_03620 [Nostoc sp. DedQUE12a]|nr:hypothetical protein [Nostoc sp. DedQUE12a]
MKTTGQLSLNFRDILPYIYIGRCYDNALLVADAYPQTEYIEGLIHNGEEWIQHAWNRFNGEEFDLTYQIHLRHLLYCDRRIVIAGTVEYLQGSGYSFDLGFTPLMQQRYRVNAQNCSDKWQRSLLIEFPKLGKL